MTPTLKLTKRLNLALSGFRRPRIYLTGSLLLLLTSCAGLKPFPTSTLYEYDAQYKVCGQYQITDPANLKFAYVKDVPCPSIFGFNSSDIPKVLNWVQDAEAYAKANCQGSPTP